MDAAHDVRSKRMTTSLVKKIGKLLRPMHYDKFDLVFRRSGPIAFDVIQISLAQYSSGITVAFGVYFKGIGQDTNPVESICHIKSGLSGVVGPCDFTAIAEDYVDTEEASAGIVAAVRLIAIPWLDSVKTHNGLTKEAERNAEGVSTHLRDALQYGTLTLR